MALSALASPAARRTAARWLLIACLLGYLLTLVVMILSGAGLQRWFFALLAWALFAYIPLRILLEAFQTIAPGMRRALVDQTAGRADRYRERASAELIVDTFYDRTVVMPRIATPAQGAKAREGAVMLLLQIGRQESLPLGVALTRCLAAVDGWVADLSGWAWQENPGNIQRRWSNVRALIALAALTKILIAAAADRGETPFTSDLDPGQVDQHLDACMDYCDDLALQVDVVPWTEPALHLDVPRAVGTAIRDTWMRYVATEPPALDTRRAFVETVTQTSTAG